MAIKRKKKIFTQKAFKAERWTGLQRLRCHRARRIRGSGHYAISDPRAFGGLPDVRRLTDTPAEKARQLAVVVEDIPSAAASSSRCIRSLISPENAGNESAGWARGL